MNGFNQSKSMLGGGGVGWWLALRDTTAVDDESSFSLSPLNCRSHRIGDNLTAGTNQISLTVPLAHLFRGPYPRP